MEALTNQHAYNFDRSDNVKTHATPRALLKVKNTGTKMIYYTEPKCRRKNGKILKKKTPKGKET